MKYRRMRLGEVIRASDQYLSHPPRRWTRTDTTNSEGDRLDTCHLPYRRPLKSKEASRTVNQQAKGCRKAKLPKR